jgi:hypothetical protein
MAGAGYKLYATGDVLTAAQVNNYLQEQTVMVFADAAARTTALASVLAEGMISYLKDTNSTEYYSGSAWVAIGGATGGGMTSIASGSLPTGASTITLSSISGSYKNLQLVIRDQYPATATSLVLQFNGNTGSVYRYVDTYYGATGPVSGVGKDVNTNLEISHTSVANSDNNNLIVVDIFDYANASTNKVGQYTSFVQSDSYAQFISNGGFSFSSTTAITSITIRNANSGVNFSGGTYVLYGVN